MKSKRSVLSQVTKKFLCTVQNNIPLYKLAAIQRKYDVSNIKLVCTNCKITPSYTFEIQENIQYLHTRSTPSISIEDLHPVVQQISLVTIFTTISTPRKHRSYFLWSDFQHQTFSMFLIRKLQSWRLNLSSSHCPWNEENTAVMMGLYEVLHQQSKPHPINNRMGMVTLYRFTVTSNNGNQWSQ